MFRSQDCRGGMDAGDSPSSSTYTGPDALAQTIDTRAHRLAKTSDLMHHFLQLAPRRSIPRKRSGNRRELLFRWYRRKVISWSISWVSARLLSPKLFDIRPFLETATSQFQLRV